MSALIMWQPVKPRAIDCSIPNQMQSALFRAFGGSPCEWELGTNDISVLNGIAAGNRHLQQAVDILIAAIVKHERIRVWAEG